MTTLDELRARTASAQSIASSVLNTHKGDRQAAAQALLAHIQTEQAALALLLANGASQITS